MLPLRAANAYSRIGLETGVAAANPHSLILMLYDGAMQAIREACGHIDTGRVPEKGRAITRAIAIIDEGLKGCLDKAGGEIAQHLAELYDYMCRRLLFASIKNDRKALDEVMQLLDELRDAWATIATAPANQTDVARLATV